MPKPSDYGTKNQINVGLDPETLMAGAGLAAYHIEAGSRKFIDFAKAMAEDLGTTINKLRLYLPTWYIQAET